MELGNEKTFLLFSWYFKRKFVRPVFMFLTKNENKHSVIQEGKLEEQHKVEDEMQMNAKNLYSDMNEPQTISELANQVENTVTLW